MILATEGVNGSVAGELEAVRDAVKQVGSMPSDQWPDAAAAPELVKNEEIFSTPRVLPFKKLKVKIKPEIVTMRADKPLDMSLRCVACAHTTRTRGSHCSHTVCNVPSAGVRRCLQRIGMML